MKFTNMQNQIITTLFVITTLIVVLISCKKESEPTPILTVDFITEFSEPDSLGVYEVDFINKSQNATSYHWDFGDGKNSTENQPSHRYEKGGIYTVRLIAYDAKGSIQIARTIEVNHLPVADFNIEKCDSLSYAPCPVQFFNLSANASLYHWDFGDGTTSTEKNPVHHYQKGGTYTIRLMAKSQWGDHSNTKTVFVPFAPPMPLADFEIQGGNCTAPCTVLFNNISQYADTLFWDFGDGQVSNKKNPEHLYLKGGTYTVRLTVKNALGRHTATHAITLVSAPVADFEIENNGCVSNCTVKFKNTSKNALVYIWDFGDGGRSDQENPSHSFTTAGVYTVTLKSINKNGTSSEKKEQVIIR